MAPLFPTLSFEVPARIKSPLHQSLQLSLTYVAHLPEVTTSALSLSTPAPT